MNLRRHWLIPVVALAILATAGAVGAVLAQQPISPMPINVVGGAGEPAQPGGGIAVGGDAGLAAPAKPLKTRVFRLKACDPEDVRGILEELLPEQTEGGAGATLGQPGVGGPFGGGAGAVLPGVGGGPPGIGGGFGPGFGAGLGGGFGGLLGGPTHSWRVTTHASSRAVIVRGSERELQIAADLVTVLEAPDDKPLPHVKSVRAFRLKHADAEELTGVVQELELQARVVAAPLAKLLIAAGPEHALSDLAELVKELDVEVKKDDKPTETKKLLPKGDQ